MLQSILNLEGIVRLEKKQQKNISGGAFFEGICITDSDCNDFETLVLMICVNDGCQIA